MNQSHNIERVAQTFGMFRRSFFCAMPCLIAIILCSCAGHRTLTAAEDDSAYPSYKYLPSTVNWQRVQEGIDRFDFEDPVMPIRYHAVRIDLETPDLELVAYPDRTTVEMENALEIDGSVKQPFVFTGMQTLSFARAYNCVVAMNATPFSGKPKQPAIFAQLGTRRQILGIHKIKGITIARPIERYAALIFERDKTTGHLRASVIDTQSEFLLSEIEAAFGGFYTVLKQGAEIPFSVRTHDSRSGAGVSDEGRFLYLLAVEGEDKSKSTGLSFPQCAAIFKKLGAETAMEFDGGSSTELCIKKQSVLSYKLTAVNANSFGFRVRAHAARSDQ
ncbi:MAG: phosphodiester glycosidase family protein [Treponema sp.]|nr:phosphodiester glycosidase family protein [Treponema sp.]